MLNEGIKTSSHGKWAIVLVALLFGASTAGAAITVSSRYASMESLSKQSLPSFQMKIPGTVWFEDAVY